MLACIDRLIANCGNAEAMRAANDEFERLRGGAAPEAKPDRPREWDVAILTSAVSRNPENAKNRADLKGNRTPLTPPPVSAGKRVAARAHTFAADRPVRVRCRWCGALKNKYGNNCTGCRKPFSGGRSERSIF